MTATATNETFHTFRIVKEIDIAAPVEVAWLAVLDEMGPESQMPGGEPYPFTLEPWPGGRWFRDLGRNTGHLWGHVQVIKPPPHPKPLLEICGPLWMSYPAISHLQYRLTPNEAGTRLTLTHRAMGLIAEEHRTGVDSGWEFMAGRVRELALKRLSARNGAR